MLGMTAWHIWTDQARAVNRRGLRTQKTRLQRLCREVFAQTIEAEFAILCTRYSSWQITSIRLKANCFATRKLCRARRYRAGRWQSEIGCIVHAAAFPLGHSEHPPLQYRLAIHEPHSTSSEQQPSKRRGAFAASRTRCAAPAFSLLTDTHAAVSSLLGASRIRLLPFVYHRPPPLPP